MQDLSCRGTHEMYLHCTAYCKVLVMYYNFHELSFTLKPELFSFPPPKYNYVSFKVKEGQFDNGIYYYNIIYHNCKLSEYLQAGWYYKYHLQYLNNKKNSCRYINEDSGITTKNPKCYFSCNDQYLQSLHDLKKNIVLIYIFFLKNVELIMKST